MAHSYSNRQRLEVLKEQLNTAIACEIDAIPSVDGSVEVFAKSSGLMIYSLRDVLLESLDFNEIKLNLLNHLRREIQYLIPAALKEAEEELEELREASQEACRGAG